jgi:hypothetical protein
VLDRGIDNVKDVRKLALDPDEHVREVVKRNWKGGNEGTIYEYNVSGSWLPMLTVDRQGVGGA